MYICKHDVCILGIFCHVPVREEDRPDKFSLGRKLFINTTQYDDLDEVIATYVQPMSDFIQQVCISSLYLITCSMYATLKKNLRYYLFAFKIGCIYYVICLCIP